MNTPFLQETTEEFVAIIPLKRIGARLKNETIMCIYYPTRGDLHFTQEEHIFPAAVGGRTALTKGMVSDEFNNNISGLEQRFIRNSLVSLPRQIYGPGKRGSMSESKATKSKVSIFKDSNGRYSLGYIKKGKPHQITTLELNLITKAVSFSLEWKPNANHQQLLEDFKQDCMEAEKLTLRSWQDSFLPEDIILFGIVDGVEEKRNAFFVKHPSSKAVLDKEKIKEIGHQLNFNEFNSEFIKERPQIHQSVDFHEDYFRVYAKIAFNYLAYHKGKNFVLKACFDPIRNWIADGGTNEFVRLNTEPSPRPLSLPKNAHSVIIGKASNMLIGHVALFEGLDTHILLTKDFQDDFSLCGMICDWERQSEYVLHNYLQKLTSELLTITK